MPELLVEFDEPLIAEDGTRYLARVWGDQDDIGRWVGWLEFGAVASPAVFWTERETVQPNRRDLEYWVTGLSEVYLEGALTRALATSRAAPRKAAASVTRAPEVARGGRRTAVPQRPYAILDPFATYPQGEGVLRAELGALSTDQLRNIVAAFGISSPETSATRTAAELQDEIVAAARARVRRSEARGLTT